MQRFDPDLTGQLKVVMSSEVEALTLSGWHLVFTFQDSLQVPTMDQEIDTRPQNNGYYNNVNGMISVTRYKPQSVTFFVMRHAPEDVIAQMNNDVKSLEAALFQRKEAQEKIEKELLAAEKRVSDAKRAADDCNARANNISGQLESARINNRKLEGDLAKVKTAIGELKFKEIVG